MMKIVKIEQNWKGVVMHETTKVDKNLKSWKEVFWTSQTRTLNFSLQTSLRYEPRTNQTRQTRTSHKLEPVSAFPSTNNQTRTSQLITVPQRLKSKFLRGPVVHNMTVI